MGSPSLLCPLDRDEEREGKARAGRFLDEVDRHVFLLTFFRFCALACLFVFWFHGTRAAAPTRRLSIAICHVNRSSMIDRNLIRLTGDDTHRSGASLQSHTCKLTARHKRVAHSTEREKRARMNATTHVMEQSGRMTEHWSPSSAVFVEHRQVASAVSTLASTTVQP